MSVSSVAGVCRRGADTVRRFVVAGHRAAGPPVPRATTVSHPRDAISRRTHCSLPSPLNSPVLSKPSILSEPRLWRQSGSGTRFRSKNPNPSLSSRGANVPSGAGRRLGAVRHVTVAAASRAGASRPRHAARPRETVRREKRFFSRFFALNRKTNGFPPFESGCETLSGLTYSLFLPDL